MAKLTREEKELKRQLKEMESAARAKALASAPVTVVTSGDEEADKISFDQWWMISQGRIKLRSHLKEVILADMQARGLSKNETQAKYDEGMRLFGYKW